MAIPLSCRTLYRRRESLENCWKGARSPLSGLSGSEPVVHPLISPEAYDSGGAREMSLISGRQVLHIRMRYAYRYKERYTANWQVHNLDFSTRTFPCRLPHIFGPVSCAPLLVRNITRQRYNVARYTLRLEQICHRREETGLTARFLIQVTYLWCNR